MYKILVILEVKDFQALDEFERKASVIMSDYTGRIVGAFETARNADGSGEEIHLVEFESEESFLNYRNDGRYSELRVLRATAISGTAVKVLLTEKDYS